MEGCKTQTGQIRVGTRGVYFSNSLKADSCNSRVIKIKNVRGVHLLLCYCGCIYRGEGGGRPAVDRAGPVRRPNSALAAFQTTRYLRILHTNYTKRQYFDRVVMLNLIL